MHRDGWYTAGMIIGIVIVVLLIGAGLFAGPYFEMRAFNKFSDQKATYWDAFFSELRVVPD